MLVRFRLGAIFKRGTSCHQQTSLRNTLPKRPRGSASTRNRPGRSRGATFLFVLLIALVLHHRETDTNEAWFELGGIQSQEMQGKLEEARKSLDTWESHFQGTEAATYAKFMKADLLYRTSDYAQAAQVYADLAQTGQPDLVKPLALSAEASSEEMAGHIPQALGSPAVDRDAPSGADAARRLQGFSSSSTCAGCRGARRSGSCLQRRPARPCWRSRA